MCLYLTIICPLLSPNCRLTQYNNSDWFPKTVPKYERCLKSMGISEKIGQCELFGHQFYNRFLNFIDVGKSFDVTVPLLTMANSP